MSSYKFPEKWSALLENEMMAQHISEGEILEVFQEDYPQGHFILYEPERHNRKMTDDEMAKYSLLWLGYATGYVRRGI